MNKITGILLAFIFALLMPLQVLAGAAYDFSSDINMHAMHQLPAGENQAIVKFVELGYKDTNLVSPFDTTRVLFSLPPNWRLAEGGEVELNFDVVLSGSDVATGNETASSDYGGTLTVVFNGQIIGTIRLQQTGSQSVRLAIPLEALQSIREDGRHQFSVSLNAQLSCTSDARTLVTIKASSLFDLDFSITAPDLTLSKLPAPFYLRSSLLPDKTIVVIPDDPSAGELRGALNVMAGFGSMIGTSFNITTANIGSLSNDDISSSNLVFVGKPGSFSQLADIKFPLPISDGRFVNLPDVALEDGILEIALSPWNPNKVVLLVSGTTDSAVGKASQAFSSGSVFIYNNPALAYVSDIQLITEDLPIIEDFTLKSIGYASETLSAIGLNNAEYVFKVSKEQLASRDASLDLIYYHSGVLDYSNSSFSVTVNDQIITSSALSKDSEQLTTLHINIPPGLLRFGENRLTVSVRMFANMSCDTTGFSDPWFIVLDESRLHLPTASFNLGASALVDFKFYPGLFTTHSELGDLAFVLPRLSPNSWKIAGELSYNLGQDINPIISNLEVAYADDVSQAIRNSKSLLLIGRASTLPVLKEINDKLPAPFDFQTDVANEQNMQVVYRVPAGVSVGYLELNPSAFNSDKYMLIVSGNSEAGLTMAGNALLTPEMRGKLAGVFVVTNGDQIATTDTNTLFSVVGNVVPGGEQVITTPVAEPQAVTPRLDRPWWLFPVVIGSAILIIVAIGFAIKMTLQGPATEQPKYSEENTKPRNL